jgi:hypothetical protein
MSGARWLQRVRRMDRDELLFRARTAARAKAEYIAGAWRPRRWRRQDLAGLLRPSAGPLAIAVERLGAGDWARAHRALAEHFHRRVSRFPLSPHALPEVAEAIRDRFPLAAAHASARADRIVGDRFDILGYEGLDFSTPAAAIDWHYDPVHKRRAPRSWWSRVRYLDPAIGDHKIIWELNRHQHFLALGRAAWLTGRTRYRTAFIRQLEAWLRDNPPLVGVNWASMLELAFRSLSWVWALHLFVEAPAPVDAAVAAADPGPIPSAGHGDGDERATPWLVDMLLGLERQLSHVERNLSLYFSPNTHLTGEALALYVAGRALPELTSAGRWADIGRRVLLDEIERQIAADGGHRERSTHYQRYTLDFYSLALAMARVTDDACADRFAETVDRLAFALRVLADPDGRVPAIGDDDGGALFPICGRPPDDVRDSLATADALLGRRRASADDPPEETRWLLGNQPAWIIGKAHPRAIGAADPLRSAALVNTGYYVSRQRPGDHVVIDGGRHGFLNGGHAHADALSLTATLDGCRLLIDPGTGTYTMSRELRDRFRGTRMHNTLTLDGRSQSVPAGPFHWRTVANSRVQRWDTGPAFDYFEGVHDGYLPAIHRRRVIVGAGGAVLVVDSVFGDEARHDAEVFWHLAPGWRFEWAERGRVSLRHASGRSAWMLAGGARTEILAGDEGGLGWHAPLYGRIEPAPTIRLAVDGAAAPLYLVTMFGMGPLSAAPSFDRLAVEGGGADPVGLAVRSGGVTDTLLFAGHEPLLPPADDDSVEGAPDRVERRAGPRPRLRAPGVETDARLLWVRSWEDASPARVAMIDGGLARTASGAGLPELADVPALAWTA